MNGTIFDIQRFCINDGPGIRSTVFLKGCMLDCKWCHNPESKSSSPQLSFHADRCINCGKCEQACEHLVHSFQNHQHIVAFDKCKTCKKCIAMCSNDALTIIGKNRSVNEILDELEKDRNYYTSSGGGITISGGEPMMQPAFAIAIAKEAKRRNLHVVLETSGFGKEQDFIEIANYVDLFLFDFKVANEKQHKEFTGVSNTCIIQNRKKLEFLKKEIVIRCPMIPSYNMNEEHLKGICEVYFESEYIKRIEILPYHTMGSSKCEDIGKAYDMKEIKDNPEDYVDEIIDKLKNMGVENIIRG